VKGDLEKAVQLEEESLRRARESGNTGCAIWVLIYLGRAILLKGDVTRALAYTLESLGSSVELPNWRSTIVGLDLWAMVRWAQGRAALATTVLAAIEPLRRQGEGINADLHPHRRHARIMAQVRERLGDPALAAAWAEGEHMTLEQAVAYALEVGEADEPTTQ